MKTKKIVKTTITKKMYGWSKWGGARFGMITRETTWSPSWVCQVCGKDQVRELPHYMIPLKGTDREYIQVCSTCKHESVINKLKDHIALIEHIRGRIANE